MGYYKIPTTSKVIQLLDKRGRLEKIIDLVLDLPTTPTEDDRYIDLTDNYVKQWDGVQWVSYVPKQGDNLYVLNRDKYFYFDGTAWKDITQITSFWTKEGDVLKPTSAQNVEITGSFIGDGSKLTGIKKLIEEFIAQSNITAGDIVAFINGQIRKGKVVSETEILNYIGISQETKLAGEITKVLIQGISDVHNNLVVGQKYYATADGDLTTEVTEDFVGIAISDTKLLVLDWQRPITLYDENSDEFLLQEN